MPDRRCKRSENRPRTRAHWTGACWTDWTTPARVVYVDDLKRLVTAHHVTWRWRGEGRGVVVLVHRHRYYAWLAFPLARGRFIAERHEERIGAGRDELRQQPRRRETTGHGYLSLTLLITHDRRRSCLARRCAHALLVCLRTTGCLFDV